MERVIRCPYPRKACFQCLEVFFRKGTQITVPMRLLAFVQLIHHILQPLGSPPVPISLGQYRQCRQVMPREMPPQPDTGGFPSLQWFCQRRKPGRDPEIMQQPVGLDRLKVSHIQVFPLLDPRSFQFHIFTGKRTQFHHGRRFYFPVSPHSGLAQPEADKDRQNTFSHDT